MRLHQRIFLRRFTPSALAVLINLPLILLNLPLGSYDAYGHIFLADHYRRAWFDLLEPKMFGGFSVASYPPLVHQLIAVLSVPLTALTSLGGMPANQARFWSEVLGYDLVMFTCLACLPLAVEHFARIFVPQRAARRASWLAVGVPSIYLAAYSFGQLPTLVATTALLWTLGMAWQFVRTGEWRDLLLTMVWAGVTAAAHHAVLLFGALAGLAMVGRVLVTAPLKARTPWLARLILVGLLGVGAGALVVWPFIAWSQNYVAQTPIDHASRHNFLLDPAAAYYFFWPMYGPLLGVLAGFGYWLIRRKQKWVKRWRHWPLAGLTLILFVLGLGGTTPLPQLLFGANWAWLTYDRFGLWASLALLPVAGMLWGMYRQTIVRVGFVIGLAAFAVFAISLQLNSQPVAVDVATLAQFLDDHLAPGERYLTLGFGDQLARLSVLTQTNTLDGNYFTARAVPELRTSGLGELDGAVWSPLGVQALLPFLKEGGQWGLRWIFNAHVEYVSVLQAAGWQLRGTVVPGVQLWYNPAPTVVTDWSAPVAVDERAGLWWGVVPLMTLTLALTLELSRRFNRRWLGFLLGLLWITWPFFYDRVIWSQTVKGVYYTYTSAVVYWGDVVALMLGVGVWFTGQWRGESLQGAGRGLGWATAALLVFVAISIPLSIEPILSLTFGLHLLALIGLVAAIAWVVPALDWRWMAGALTLGLVIQSLIAIGQAITQNTWAIQGLGLQWPGPLEAATQGASVVGLANGARWLRAYGSLPHPNILGGYLVVTLTGPLLGYLRTGKVRWLGPLALGITALMLTFSRAGWVAGMVMAVVVVFWLPKPYLKRVAEAFVGMVILVGALTIGLSGLVWVRATASSDSVREVSSTLERIELARLALDYFKERPLTGSGATTFPEAMMAHGEISGEPVHNVPLLVLAETGLGGGAAIAAFGLALMWVAWRWRGTGLMFALATAALFALLTIAMFDHFLWSLSEGRLWFTIALGWWLGALNAESSEVALGVEHAQLAHAPIEVAVDKEGDKAEE